jgi:putative DNA primase/helicase
MRNYGRLFFATNELPPQFFTEAPLTKRAAIILFDQQIKAEDKDTDFVEKIIANELPGVMNWIITVGLDSLLETRHLDPPPCCIAEMEQIRREVDPLSMWLVERDYQIGNTHWITVAEAYDDFDKFCKANNNRAPATKKFTKRLRELGYKTDDTNHSIGLRFYYTTTIPETPAPPTGRGRNSGGISRLSQEEEDFYKDYYENSTVASDIPW